MVEAAPAAAFVVAEAELLLELLVVPLDPPAQLGEGDETFQGRVGRAGWRTSIWSARARLRGHSTSSQSSGQGSCRLVAMSRPDPQGREARAENAFHTLAPGDSRQAAAGSARASSRPARLMAGWRRSRFRGSAAARPRLGGKGSVPAGQTVAVGCTPTT